MSRRRPNSLIENFYYEAKPILLTAFAFLGLSSYYSNYFLVKLNIFILFFLAAYISYSRLIHRGYLSRKN